MNLSKILHHALILSTKKIESGAAADMLYVLGVQYVLNGSAY